MSEHTGAVVVGVDGSEGAVDAVRWAAAVAAGYEAPLHIVHAMPSVGYNLTDAAAAIRAAAMAYQSESAEEIVRGAVDAVRARHADLAVTTESADSPADETLLRHAGAARMIVVGSTQVTRAGAVLIGSTTLAVATHASCPVVAWRGPNTEPTDQPIVVGVDGTESAQRALGAAFEFADRFGAPVSAVRSWSIPGPVAALSNPLLIDFDALEGAEWATLADLVDGHNKAHPHVRASCFIEQEGPAAALLHHIETDRAQMVAVGSRGRTALASALLGSTALNLLNHATVPVMICR